MTGDSSWTASPFVVDVSDLVDETSDELATGIEIDIDEHQASNTIPTRLLLLRISLSNIDYKIISKYYQLDKDRAIVEFWNLRDAILCKVAQGEGCCFCCPSLINQEEMTLQKSTLCITINANIPDWGVIRKRLQAIGECRFSLHTFRGETDVKSFVDYYDSRCVAKAVEYLENEKIQAQLCDLYLNDTFVLFEDFYPSEAENSLLVQPCIPFEKAVEEKSFEIDFKKITLKLDQRTTWMIRNIPNKYSQSMLIDMLNQTHFGTFDFIYLRMDFKNKCNVGYAFINFIDPMSILSFAARVMGKRWPRFNSDKICHLTFARIQGKVALVEKFRHSKVMMEPANYRPKIYFTEPELRGIEAPFPL